MQYPLTDFMKEEEETENVEEEGKEEFNEGNTGTESRTTLGRQPSMVSMDTSQDLNGSQDTGTRRPSVAVSNNSGISLFTIQYCLRF